MAGVWLSSAWAYNYETDTWNRKPDMNFARSGLMCGLARRFDEDAGETVTEVVVAGGIGGTTKYDAVKSSN